MKLNDRLSYTEEIVYYVNKCNLITLELNCAI